MSSAEFGLFASPFDNDGVRAAARCLGIAWVRLAKGSVMGAVTGSVVPPEPPAAELDWTPVLAFLERLRDPSFDPGSVAESRRLPDGSLTMPAAHLSDTASDVVRVLYAQQVVAGFDWSTWIGQVGQQLFDDEARLEEATLEECRMLLAAHARADRFAEGHLFEVFASGHILAIVERIADLVGTDS